MKPPVEFLRMLGLTAADVRPFVHGDSELGLVVLSDGSDDWVVVGEAGEALRAMLGRDCPECNG